ncbi:hypothetical protein B7486_40690 [cyanobacterium TDX16]|nr:hypothetical protein B7486_40690 [cyanobacterium TDX16]
MDSRQKEIFHTWFKQGVENASNPYFGFISLWIAFNAYCVAKYSTKAKRLLAQLNNDKGFRQISGTTVEITEGLISENNGVYSIDIKQPSRIRFVVKERFIESAVFDAFTKDFASRYVEIIQQEADFAEAVNALRETLRKEEYFYVIDMSRHRDYKPSFSYKELIERSIIVPFEDINDLAQLKNVLYQVRCNLFHGEKLPGILNDDKIVRAAYPVLLTILVALQPVND